MTDAPVPAPTPNPGVKPHFGVGDALTDSFKLYFSRFFYFAGVSAAGTVGFFIVLAVVATPIFIGVFASQSGDPDSFGAMGLLIVPVILISIVYYAFFYAVLTRSAITVKLGRGAEFGAAMRAGLASCLPLAVYAILLIIPLYLGYLFFIVPGLFLTAMLYAMVPAAAFERRGFGAIGRSLELTQGYRWALSGFIIVFALLSMVIGLVLSIVVTIFTLPLSMASLSSDGSALFIISQIVSLGLNVVLSALLTPLGVMAIAVAYTRLREIKEGSGEEILKVFE